MRENQKTPMWRKICYGLGAGGGCMMTTLVQSFLLAYYTDSALLGAAAVSTMFLMVRVLDAVTDLGMGCILDKTNTRWGKARPWLAVATPLMFISIILVLHVPMGWDNGMKMVYAYVTYIFINCIVYTIYGIAHGALLARMSLNVEDRTSTATVNGVLNNLFGFVIAGGLISYIHLNYDWNITAFVIGSMSSILVLAAVLGTKEQVGMKEEAGQVSNMDCVPMTKALTAAMKNKYVYVLFFLSVAILLVNGNFTASLIYYCKNVLDDPGFMTTLMSIGQLPSVAVVFLMPYISKKFSVKTFMGGGAVLLCLGFALIIVNGDNRTAVLIATLLKSIGIAPCLAGMRICTSYVIDYGEWKSTVRTDGVVNGISSFGAKIGIGFGSAIAGWLLAFGGYNAAVQVQSASAISAIRFACGGMNLILGLLLLASVLMMNVEKYIPQAHEELRVRHEKMMERK